MEHADRQGVDDSLLIPKVLDFDLKTQIEAAVGFTI